MSKKYWEERIETAFGGYSLPEVLRRTVAALRDEVRPKLLKDSGADSEWRKLRRLESKVDDQRKVVCGKLAAYACREGLGPLDTSHPDKMLTQLTERLNSEQGLRALVHKRQSSLLDLLHRAQTPKETREAVAKIEQGLAEFDRLCHDRKAVSELLSQCVERRRDDKPANCEPGTGAAEPDFFANLRKLRDERRQT
jgi:hypothetical protein